MFSGIIESLSQVESFLPEGSLFHLSVQKPSEFNDIKIGDSISVNGVCLTVEAFGDSELQFSVSPETLAVSFWKTNTPKKGDLVNLERSLKFGDRVHGHLVSGHVEGVAKVIGISRMTHHMIFEIEIPESYNKWVWKKGSLSVHGVSLTVNAIDKNRVEFCLIPETLKRTNLRDLKAGDIVNFETDYYAKALSHRERVEI